MAKNTVARLPFTPHNSTMGMFFDQAVNIPAAFFNFAKDHGDRILFSQSEIISGEDNHPRPRRQWTYGEVAEQVRGTAHYLISQGFKPGDRAAIISNSRPEWMIADLAILAAGGVVASVYQSLTAPEVGYLLYDSGAEFIFVENEEQIAKIDHLLNGDFEVAATEERPAHTVRLHLKKLITFEDVREHALAIPLADAASFRSDAALPHLERSALATLVYTSGTSGPPKGVMQTHGNHLSNLRQAFEAGMYTSESSIILFLPLAHSFARLMAYIGCLAGALLNFPATTDRKSSRLDQQSVTRDIAEADATIIPLVPRILEKMKLGIEQRAGERGLSALLLLLMIRSAAARQRALRNSTPIPFAARLGYAVTAPLRSITKRKLFGDRFVNAISGGAKLGDEINYFFESLGICVLQGYGLTETCVATNVNRPATNRIGTVGPVLSADIELRIADDGEILFRGPNIALGYYHRHKATEAAWDSAGWFHTGDVGVLSADGYLSITGRKKELIVTSGGKKIAPDGIESLVKMNYIFSQVVLVGESKPYCCAIVTLNSGALEEVARERSLPVSQPYSTDVNARQIVGDALAVINKQLASFETIKRFLILDSDFSIENGMLTPTFKVKRTLVIKTYAAEIEKLYQGGKD